jgi:hypothetical protein
MQAFAGERLLFSCSAGFTGPLHGRGQGEEAFNAEPAALSSSTKANRWKRRDAKLGDGESN